MKANLPKTTPFLLSMIFISMLSTIQAIPHKTYFYGKNNSFTDAKN